MSPHPIPLCVDFDGSLIRSDSLVESLFALLKRNLFYALLLPFWLLGGKAAFKARVAERVVPDPAYWPYHEELLAWLREQRGQGRSLVLATAAHERIARSVGEHLGLFERVFASDGAHNLSGRHKAAALVQAYGVKGFDYVGNSHQDLPVWAQARSAILVSDSAALRAQVADQGPVERVFRPGIPAQLRDWLRALRLYQWLKNLLLFLPLLTAHGWNRPEAVGAAVLAFVAFGLCASSAYLLNDLMDLEADRHHPRKRHRPFAAARIQPVHGVWMVPLLILGAGALALSLSSLFLASLAAYLVLTLAYSAQLKRIAMVDVMTLAALYTLRIIAGAAAIAVPLSFWLLAFSMFLFLSLAMVKRYAELVDIQAREEQSAKGRGYAVDDLPLLQHLGGSAGYLSVLVLALYINSPASAQLYSNLQAMWLMCPLLLFWVSRVWLKTHRKEMHDDPILFAVRDPVSRGIAVLGLVVILIAL